MRTFKLVAAIAVALTGVGGGVARASGSADAKAAVVIPIAIEKTRDLDFGHVVPGPTDGTVLMSTAGERTVTGGTALGNAANKGPAIFKVTGVPGLGYSISLPDPIVLESGVNTMTVNSFVSTPSGNGILGGGGDQSFNVGATLHVGANQSPGTYAKSFDVTVAYN